MAENPGPIFDARFSQLQHFTKREIERDHK